MNKERVSFLESLAHIAKSIQLSYDLSIMGYSDPSIQEILPNRETLDIVVKYGGIDLPPELIEEIAKHFKYNVYQCRKCKQYYRELDFSGNGICKWECVFL